MVLAPVSISIVLNVKRGGFLPFLCGRYKIAHDKITKNEKYCKLKLKAFNNKKCKENVRKFMLIKFGVYNLNMEAHKKKIV